MTIPTVRRAPESRTYVASGTVVAAAGTAIEIIGGAAATTGTRVEVLSIVISKPSVAATITIQKRSAACTGGTSSTATVVPADSGDAAFGGSIKLYTVDPTEGTNVGEIGRATTLQASETATWTFGDATFGQKPIELLTAAEVVTIMTDTAATLTFRIVLKERN